MRDCLIVVIVTVFFAASQANLAPIFAPLHPYILLLQLSFTPEAFWHVIGLWGASGLAVYRAHFQFDNVHRSIYGAFGFLLVSRTSLFSSASPRAYRAILLSLPVACLFDLAKMPITFIFWGRLKAFALLSFQSRQRVRCSNGYWLALLFAGLVAIRFARKLWASASRRRNGAQSRAGR
ncbi:MAG: hypothetical protein HY777_11770 [Betaproteobacteria bacterium]|nr:hypothetical protein [Betaproteobacteria bacterium]